MSGLQAVGYFLIALLFGFLIFCLWARLAFSYLRISALNPIALLIHQVTDPLLLPLQKLFPFKSNPRYDWRAAVLLLIVEILKGITLSILAYGTLISWIWLILYVVADLIIQPCNLLFYAILIRVLMDWINPQGIQHPISYILHALTNPLLKFGQSILPNISGFDFSPLIVMLILKIITLFIEHSLPWHLI